MCNLLTSLKLSSNQLLYEQDQATIERFIKNADSTINSAVSAIQHMTFLDKLQKGNVKPSFVQSDITKLVSKTLDSRRYKWAGSGIELRLHGERTLKASDSFFLDMIFGELIDNACRYKSKAVDVSVDSAGNRTRVVVKDDGEGIEAAELAKVFDPYYRILKHRKRSPRAGLGLTTVKAAANRLDGDIKLDSSPNWGTRVEVLL